MSYRPDAPAFVKPVLTSDRIVTASTDTAPTIGPDGAALEAGQLWEHDDTGGLLYWTGTAWKAVDVDQREALKLSLLFEIRDLLSDDD